MRHVRRVRRAGPGWARGGAWGRSALEGGCFFKLRNRGGWGRGLRLEQLGRGRARVGERLGARPDAGALGLRGACLAEALGEGPEAGLKWAWHGRALRWAWRGEPTARLWWGWRRCGAYRCCPRLTHSVPLPSSRTCGRQRREHTVVSLSLCTLTDTISFKKPPPILEWLCMPVVQALVRGQAGLHSGKLSKIKQRTKNKNHCQHSAAATMASCGVPWQAAVCRRGRTEHFWTGTELERPLEGQC